MPQTPKIIAKAELREVLLGTSDKEPSEINDPERTVKFQFNPQTLKVSFANQIKGDNTKGGSGIQFVGKGTTKLSLDLWFDVTAPLPSGEKQQVNDVRKLTEKVKYFITPKEQRSKGNYIPPGVRFIWGSFLFDGIMESMNENLEFFSEDGRPLRASVSINITSQEIQLRFNKDFKGPAGTTTPGQRPLQQVRAGDSVPKIAARTGQIKDWTSIAAANNIENPRRLTPGIYIDINLKLK